MTTNANENATVTTSGDCSVFGTQLVGLTCGVLTASLVHGPLTGTLNRVTLAFCCQCLKFVVIGRSLVERLAFILQVVRYELVAKQKMNNRKWQFFSVIGILEMKWEDR